MATMTATMTTVTMSNLGQPRKNERVAAAGLDNIYPDSIDSIREQEYPTLSGTTYLDHAGTTLYAKSMIESYTADLMSNIFGNPHSASASSQLTSQRINNIRLQVLQFVKAEPEKFDVIFVANATAAIKLVADCFRDYDEAFRFGYHAECHTSMVGVREMTRSGDHCFHTDEAVETWIHGLVHGQTSSDHLMLFGYPGQSNMTGRRLPLSWSSKIRKASYYAKHRIYTLLDAAALATTHPLDFSNADSAPDFTALSFYKIFGFPDLGALIVRRASSDPLICRKYFGGGTVDAVSMVEHGTWHMKRVVLHSQLEDGTLPFHNIIALEHAMKTHKRLFGSMRNISNHTAALAASMCSKMRKLTHSNGNIVCKIYREKESNGSTYGPVIAFNIFDISGKPVSNIEVEKLSIVRNLQFRTGGLCNPGGIARHLDLTTEDIKRNYASGHRCGGQTDIFDGRPTGVIRVSLGAMSNESDVNKMVNFLQEFYVAGSPAILTELSSIPRKNPRFLIESMSVFPIKSCSAFKIPPNTDWEVSMKGLVWDREWCLVHQGSNIALSQKQYPKMALLQPSIDLDAKMMTVCFYDGSSKAKINIGLDDFPSVLGSLAKCDQFKQSQSTVCGETVPVHIYTSPKINEFFSDALGVPCALARYFNLDNNQRYARLRKPRSKRISPNEPTQLPPSIKLSNESPILLVSRSSVNQLNKQIRQYRSIPQEILPDSFRANIIVSELGCVNEIESPYIEDVWQSLSIGSTSSSTTFAVLGPCQRCQMVCVDQTSAKRRQEPFCTLAKTRRWDGGVWFGVHLSLSESDVGHHSVLRVGDIVLPS